MFNRWDQERGQSSSNHNVKHQMSSSAVSLTKRCCQRQNKPVVRDCCFDPHRRFNENFKEWKEALELMTTSQVVVAGNTHTHHTHTHEGVEWSFRLLNRLVEEPVEFMHESLDDPFLTTRLTSSIVSS